MDVWRRERSLARTTVAWGSASVLAGVVLAARPGQWWRAFGLQTAGWGAVDVVIAAVADRLQAGRMRRSPDPYAAGALARESRSLYRVLLVNVVADAGYVVLGAVLARRPAPRVAGAGSAVVVQGAFLLAHDAHHAWRTRPARQ